MNRNEELLKIRNTYSAKLNRAVRYIAKQKLTRTGALQYLNRGLLKEGRNLAESLLAYLDENMKCRPDKAYFNFAVSFIDTFHDPYFTEHHRTKKFTELETVWFTSLNSIILSFIKGLKLADECLAVLHALALYSQEKNITEKQFNALCDVLSLSSYPYILEQLGFDSYGPAAVYFSEILEGGSRRLSENKSRSMEDKFFLYLENLKIPESELPDRLEQAIANADSDYILEHITSYPDHAIRILSDQIPGDRAEETVKFIAEIERSRRNEIHSIEKKYSARFAAGILKRAGYPEGLTHENVENLNMIRTAQAISYNNTETTAGLFKNTAAENDHVFSDIKHGFFLFTDFEHIDDRSIQMILREVDARDLTIALKGSPPVILDAVFRNMSNRAASLLKEDMEYTGEVSQERIQSCRDLIQKIGNRLLRSGDIFPEFNR